MKKIISFVVMLTILVSAISFTLVAEAVSANFIKDPGFESKSLESNVTASSCGLELTKTQKRSGSQSIKIKNRTANYASVKYQMAQVVNENGSGVYRFTCYVKVVIPASAPKQTAQLYALFTPTWTNNIVDGSGKIAGTSTYPYKVWYAGTKVDIPNDGGWHKITIEKQINKINKMQLLNSVEVYLSQDSTEYNSHNNFEIYVDDCEFVKVSSVAEDNGNKNLAAPAVPVKNADGSVTHADGKVYVNDPNLVYTGRWNKEYNTFYYSGWQSYVEVKFTGTSKLKAMGTYNNQSLESQVYVEIFDEQGKSVLPAANVSLGEVGRYFYMKEGADLTFGAVKLDPTKVYTARIIAQFNGYRMLFQGLYMDAGAKTLPIAQTPKLEIIGDSISAGYIDATHTTGKGIAWTDSYSYRVGNILGWQTSAVAKSGIAVAHSTKELMPVFYERFAHDDPTVANDFSKQSIDYIVINLGTNDGSAVTKENFKAEYKKFVQKLLANHPNAVVFVMQPYSDTATHYRFGNELKAIADEFDRVEYISTADWNLHQESTKGSTYLTADKIHLLPAGADYAAEKLAAVLKAYHEGASSNTGNNGNTGNSGTNNDGTNVTTTPDSSNGDTTNPSVTSGANATPTPITNVGNSDNIDGENGEEAKTSLTWLWVSLGAVVVAGGGAAAYFIIKKKESVE